MLLNGIGKAYKDKKRLMRVFLFFLVRGKVDVQNSRQSLFVFNL